MKRRLRRYLDTFQWPKIDRSRWAVTFAAPIDSFDQGGSSAYLSSSTVRMLEYRYATFLYFLAHERPELLCQSPAARITPQTVKEFIEFQPSTCRSVTRAMCAYHLWLAAQHMYPAKDWSWLLKISNRLKARAKPKPERHHLVTSETLYKLGIKLMDEAVASGKPLSTWGIRNAYRDGLIISLLAAIPVRRRTLAALQLKKHLVRSGSLWWLDIPAEDVKNKRPLEYPLSEELSHRLTVYLNEIRSALPGAAAHGYLWVTGRGRPVRGHVIYHVVCQRTRRALGFPVALHRFRRAAATFWSIRDPKNVRGSKDLLGHAKFDTTERYYVMSQSRQAGRAFARAVAKVRRTPQLDQSIRAKPMRRRSARKKSRSVNKRPLHKAGKCGSTYGSGLENPEMVNSIKEGGRRTVPPNTPDGDVPLELLALRGK
jgi:integrase